MQSMPDWHCGRPAPARAHRLRKMRLRNPAIHCFPLSRRTTRMVFLAWTSYLVAEEQDTHASQSHQTQSADPPTPKYERPMTYNAQERLLDEFEVMEDERDTVDKDLVNKFQTPADMSTYAAREQLLQKAEELVRKE
ncbi:hypothetical protein CONLIGDRAFT_710722, partial [Coniochaeta ligniaria NRRL 30616]